MSVKKTRRVSRNDTGGIQLTGNSKIEGLIVSDSAQFPQNTTIGDVTPEEIKYLHGATSNIQTQLDEVKQLLEWETF